jgi:hypothetical protein
MQGHIQLMFDSQIWSRRLNTLVTDKLWLKTFVAGTRGCQHSINV